VERVSNESRPNRRLAPCSASFTATYGGGTVAKYQIEWRAQFRQSTIRPKS
jgi:hypothetical protein